MVSAERDRLRAITNFASLIEYLRDELDWPINDSDFDALTFVYEPEELGIDPRNAAKIDSIRQLRPLTNNQPWGIFFVEFEPTRLPVIALRRILNSLVLRKRASANNVERAAWQMDDLLFISNYGDDDRRQINLAHFANDRGGFGLASLRVLGWDNRDTPLHLDHVSGALSELTWPKDEGNVDVWRKSWGSAFTIQHREVITTSRELAIRLAELARATRDRISSILDIETKDGPVTRLMIAFRQALVHDLNTDSFADMYAQTVAYGLLSARVANPLGNMNSNSSAPLPITNPFLRDLMQTFLGVDGAGTKAGSMAGLKFDELGVMEVIELLNAANMEAVVRDFGDNNPQEDPVIHFYELFLTEYDSRQRLQRGVFYTPRPVVSFIVRSVDELLRTEFGLTDGLADITTWNEMAKRFDDLRIPEGTSPDQAFVQILDPATGTGTFLVEVIDVVHKTMTEKWKREGHSGEELGELWNEYVADYLLPRLHGYELLMAPYAIAHMKIGLKLYETGYRFGSDERVRIYLTNTLEPAVDFSGRFAFAVPALAHEALAVNTIKRSQRFTVVIGNPPYSKMSANLAPAAVALVEPFRSVKGERIVERGALALELNLQDDYVKFWGYLCARMADSGAGVASYITNSRYLSAPTLRGLRAHFSDNFRQGIFLDLGGQRSERKATGTVDENVFDIEQGVAIGALISRSSSDSMDHVLFKRMTGERHEKHKALAASVISDTETRIPIVPPMFRFIRASDATDEEFESWPSLDSMMPLNSGSIITSRDNLAIDFDPDVLLEKVERFARSPRGDQSIQKEIGFSVKAKWDVERCKTEIRGINDLGSHVRRILYRPFDYRYVFYLPSLLDTPSRPVCQSVWGCDNLVLLTPGVKTSSDFTHVLISRTAAEKKACSHDRATQMFPLYAYDGDLLQTYSGNIDFPSPEKLEDLKALAYIYAVLHSPQYRSRYGSALRDSYPRVPLAVSTLLIDELCRLGQELIDLHLLESPLLEGAATTFEGSGGFRVEKISHSDSTVWIDKERSRGFKGVPEEVWEFYIGGYQVCEKWLKDRGPKKGEPGRVLTTEDLAHYQKIIVALSETIRLMEEIDQVIDQHGGWPDAFAEGPQDDPNA